MPNTEPLLKVEDVAKWANVHPETVRRWTREGALTAITLPGGGRRFRLADVEALLAAGDAA